jgi:hypothetical protein
MRVAGLVSALAFGARTKPRPNELTQRFFQRSGKNQTPQPGVRYNARGAPFN